MEKMVFKNEILNIVFGSLLIILVFVGYFLDYIEDYLPYIVGAVIILLSAKRFLYTFKKTSNKNATLILVIEFILDLVFAGLLMFYIGNVELFLGLVIYTRGVAYLIINFVTNRKANFDQFIINIIYVTFGTFLIFTSYNLVEFLIILVCAVILIVGAVFLFFGIRVVVANNKNKEKKVKKEIKVEETKEIETDVEEPDVEEPDDDSEEEEESEVEEKIDYSSKNMYDLRNIAKKRNMTGVSQLNKADLIAKLEE